MLRPQDLVEGRYKITGPDPLGQGGMGKVWQARDSKVGTIVAVKEFEINPNYKISKDEKEKLIALFGKEAELLAGLEHEAFPKVRDNCRYEETPCIVMDFVSGDDFSELLRQRKNEPFEEETLLNWTDQLLDALDYLHTLPNPVIHKDIKPENLKLTRNNRIKVLDFGIAKGHIGEMTIPLSSVPFGTVQYAPLEQALKASPVFRIELSKTNKDKVNRFISMNTCPQSDIFSLCATVYRLLAGKLPEYFDAPSRATFVWNNQADPLPDLHEINPNVSLGLSDLIKKGMSLEIKDRIESAAEMREAVQGIIVENRRMRDEEERKEIKEQLQSEFEQKLTELNTQFEKKTEATTRKLNEDKIKTEEYRQRVERLEKSLEEANKTAVEAENFKENIDKLKGDLPKIKNESGREAINAFKNGLLSDFGIKADSIPEEYKKSDFFSHELALVTEKIRVQLKDAQEFTVSEKKVSVPNLSLNPGRIAMIASLLTIGTPIPLFLAWYFAWPTSTFTMELTEKLLMQFLISPILSLTVPLCSLVVLFIVEKIYGVTAKGGSNRFLRFIRYFCGIVFVCGISGALIGNITDVAFNRNIVGVIRGNILGMAVGYLIFSLYLYRELAKKGPQKKSM